MFNQPGGVVRVHDIPASLRDLCPFEPDYVDMFTSRAPGARQTPAEQWARAAMEGAAAPGRFLAWRVLCALRLQDGDGPEHIAGWRIADRGETWIRVEARSWFMTANIVFRTDEDRVLFGTFVRYDARVGRLIWTPVSAGHRTVAPGFLAGGVRRVERARNDTRR
jgi:hypothetical protein